MTSIEQPDPETDEQALITAMFIDEARELLADADALILRLEEDPLDPSVVDVLFRKLHSVKGGARAVPRGTSLGELAHAFESALTRIKKGEWKPDAQAIDDFLSAAELCRTFLEFLIGEGSIPESVKARHVELLSAFAAQNAVSMPRPSLAASVPVIRTGGLPEPSESPERAQEDTVNIPRLSLDRFTKACGDLITIHGALQELQRDFNESKLRELVESMDHVTDHVHRELMNIRKIPLETAFGQLPRLTRQAARELGKNVKLATEGLHIAVDRSIGRALSTCMVHMIRNSVDHGIESPEERERIGKPAQGQISVVGAIREDRIFLKVADDGRGIIREKVLRKAIEKQLISPCDGTAMNDEAVSQLIFLPGFSTADAVTNVSGRGVGMDVVKSSIEGLGGKIEIRSQAGRGTAFLLEIPIPNSVVIEKAIIAESFGVLLAFPMKSVSRMISPKEVWPLALSSSRFVQLDGQTVRVLNYRELAAKNSSTRFSENSEGSIIFLKEGSSCVGVHVDSIMQPMEVVVRPFDPLIPRMPGFSGTALLAGKQVAYLASAADFIQFSNSPKDLAS